MKTTVRLTESAVMLAVAFVLSLIPVVQMPFGGDVTLASMLPIILIAYRHGTPWGLLAGFAGSLLQLLTGLDNLSYATSAAAVVAIILLDYVLAFTVLGLGGLFRRHCSQSAALTWGVLLCCAVRFLCHFVSGFTVWRGVDVPLADAMTYSAAYNAAYMIPETIVTVAAATALSVSLDITGETPRRAAAAVNSAALIGALSAVICTAVGAIWLFGAVQTEEGFDLTALSQGDGVAIAVCAVLATASILVSITAKRRQN